MTQRPDAPRRGRPRDRDTHAEVLDATRRMLLEVGYRGLTFDAVATAAGTARSTLYRWWPTRGSLVLEATAEHLSIEPVPDSGSSREDVRTAIRQLIATFSDPLTRIVILAAISGLDGDPELATAFRDSFVYPWRASAAEALQRSIERGDLPHDSNVGFLLNVMVGTVFQSTITVAEPVTEGLEGALVELILGRYPDRASQT